RNAADIENLTMQLDTARRGEASISRQLLQIRERETYYHSLGFGGYEGTTTAIAQRLADEASAYAWLEVRPAETDPPPLTNTQALTLLLLLRHLPPERRLAVQQVTLASGDVPTPDE